MCLVNLDNFSCSGFHMPIDVFFFLWSPLWFGLNGVNKKGIGISSTFFIIFGSRMFFSFFFGDGDMGDGAASVWGLDGRIRLDRSGRQASEKNRYILCILAADCPCKSGESEQMPEQILVLVR